MAQGRQPCGNDCGTVIIESHAVDERPIAGQAEESRFRVPWLSQSGNRAHLDMVKPQRIHPSNGHAVLIKTGGKPQR